MTVTVVVGGQAGSEGKGAVVAHLHKTQKFELGVRVGGSNAGHSVVDAKGRKWAFRHLPVACVVDAECDLVLAQGSEIDLQVLIDEIEAAQEAGYSIRRRLYIDSEATFVTENDKQMEVGIGTGTTGKGVGGARANRALRQAMLMRQVTKLGDYHLADTAKMMRPWDVGDIMIEGTQGYQLGSHSGQYPYVTSGDCRAQDFMAQAGLAPQDANVWVVLRTRPIRIAGNSGPLEGETTWAKLGLKEEQTTVTKKTRRVGEWNMQWAVDAIDANCGTMPVRIALTMCDYNWPEMEGKAGIVERQDLPRNLQKFIQNLEDAVGHAGKVRLLGTSDRTMIDLVG